MSGGFSLFIIGWAVIMIVLLAIGGFFMFRKFLKRLPKEDGKSDMDWEEYYLEETKHMWGEQEKQLLEELVAPVPELFRDIARQKIASKIGETALKKDRSRITEDVIVEGYIIATPKRDHKFLIKTLEEKNIDLTPYRYLLQE
ncbi:hypothetical protein GCM10007216_19590 [Thalassobacillus devorans]|uniref:DUF2621 domain-containing protein n=1 Tax=Thalassobacillus devorans TaxID=279813 RepID=A0ABQ1P4S6_9BACI|nr:DUF2621 family protein [Thalassobacillus devorans]NIK28096.1 hypothetical protein [Thalassobacillus devorans]GGC88895.1 hypothetical protein GCM10007216_19590 [Thalassobacillus devorans]